MCKYAARCEKRLEEGRELIRQSSFSEAVAAFEKLTRAYPSMVQVWFGLWLRGGLERWANRFGKPRSEAGEGTGTGQSGDFLCKWGISIKNHRHLDKARESFR